MPQSNRMQGVYPQPRAQTMRPTNMSLRDRIYSGILGMVGGTDDPAARMKTESIMGALDMGPGAAIGLIDMLDAANAYSKGDKVQAAELTAMGMAAGLPGGRKAAKGLLDAVSPTKTQKAYKLFRTKPNDDTLYPLFVNADKGVPTEQWIPAEVGQMTNTGQVKSSIGSLAYRPGWHAGDAPSATHIGGKSSKGLKKPDYRPATQSWAEVELPDDVDWQAIANERASRNKAGEIIPRTAQISDQIPEGGYYRYKTNPNMQGNWLIGGAMRVNKPLAQSDAVRIGQELGSPDLPSLPEVISQKGLKLDDMSASAIKELKTYYPDFYQAMSNRAK